MALTPLPTPGSPDGDPAALGAVGVLARVEANLLDRRRAGVEELQLALAWADLHSGDVPDTGGRAVPGGDRLVTLGGDGTPKVADLCLEELTMARRAPVRDTRRLLADALDLRHRLPRLWAALGRLECETWLARKIAAMTRTLDRHKVGLVDTAVTAALSQAPARVLAIAEAKKIEADTDLHHAELRAKARRRGVWLGRLTPTDPADPDSGPGNRAVYAKVAPAAAHFVNALISQIATRLAADPALRALHHPDLDDNPSGDELRAAAFGWLARPDQINALLTPKTGEEKSEAASEGAREESKRPTPGRRAVVYVHLHEASLLDAAQGGDGVARAEAIGPVLLTHLKALLGPADVDRIELKPVIDLNTVHAVNAYEHPETIKERTRLRLAVADVFPYAVTLTPAEGRVDHDHPVPYQPDGPPGQTSDLNIAPLTRRSHRAKTHAGHRVEQLDLGRYLWRSPHGRWHLVDPTGTHPLTHGEARLLRMVHTRRDTA